MHFNPSLLVVEDDPMICMDYVEAFKEAGYDQIRSTGNATGAVKIAREFMPDGIVMDIRLGKDEFAGIEAAKRIRDELAIPSFYVSSFLHGEVKRRADETNPVGFAHKPISSTALPKRVIESLLFNVRWSSPELFEHARKWMFGPRQSDVSNALYRIQWLLEHCPLRIGESRETYFSRVHVEGPVTVAYEVIERDSVITQFSCRPYEPPAFST